MNLNDDVHDLENPFISDNPHENITPETSVINPTNSFQNFFNLPNPLQQKYGNSSKIKWVFNQMLKMNFSHESLVSIFNTSISPDEENQSKEEILNLAIDTYLAQEYYEDKHDEDSDNLSIIDSASFTRDPPRFFSHLNTPQSVKPFMTGKLNDEKLCNICYGKSATLNINRCGHRFCIECIFNYLKENVINGKVAKLCCPSDKCDNELLQNEIKEYLSLDLELVKKYVKFKKNLEISLDPKHRWCVRPGCEYLVEGDAKNPKTECKCGQIMCFNCNNPWHEGQDCEHAIDTEYKRYAEKGKVKNCPKCHSRIEKNEGCNHIHCTQCKYDFCWLCNREYKHGHYEFYNIFGCPMMMYTRLNNTRFHGLVHCLKKSALILVLILGMILAAGLIIALLPIAGIGLLLLAPVFIYIKVCEPRKDFKGISIGIMVFILGLPLTPFILLLVAVPGSCIALCCKNRFEEIYL